jgi:uncharacterized membrane protein YcfT
MLHTSPNVNGKDRVAWVDYSKGFCIIMVVMMHSTLGVGNAMGGTGFMHDVVTFARPFRMPDFFMIAGLFLPRTIGRDWRTFTDRKVIHFVYFFILWLAIQVAIKAGPSGPAIAAHEFAFGLIEPLGTLWFIYLLPIFFVAAKLLRRVPWPVVFVAAALLETARVNTGWTVVDESCSRFVYFYSGYIFSDRIFALANWVGAHRARATLGLAGWALVEALATYTPAPSAAYANLAAVPGVSLLAGFAGACAVVTGATLLSTLRGTQWLRYCGRNSIVIYLGFFLPMATARAAIVHTGAITSIGVASALVTLAGVCGALLMHALVSNTPLAFLYVRPSAFRLTQNTPSKKAAAHTGLATASEL